MRDDRGDVQAALQHHGHHVPGLVHLPSVDAPERELIEDHRVPVDRERLLGKPEHRDPRPVRHVREHVVERGRVPAHLEADVEPLLHPELRLRVRDRALAHVQGEGHAHLPGELQPVGVHVGDDDVSGAGVPDDRRRHQPDRPGARDQHVLTEHRELQGRVHRVAERVEDRRDVSIDRTFVMPHVGHRKRDVLGERARPVHADPLRERAEVASPRHAVPAPAADDVAFPAHEVALAEVAHVGADLGDLADELVPDDQRQRHVLLGPLVPVVDVEVGPADPGSVHADQDVVDPDLGLRDLAS